MNKSELIARCTVNGETNWNEYRQTVHTYSAAIDTLESIVAADRADGRTPAQTVAAFVDAVSYDVANIVIASAVNACGEWDKRVSSKARKWAAEMPNAYDRESAIDMRIYSDRIHRAHIDQLARAMMEYTPAPEAPAEEAREAQDDAEIDPADIVSIASERIHSAKCRSAWARGVRWYAEELAESLLDGVVGGWFDLADLESPRLLEKAMLNGAEDWTQYSWGGCSLVYDQSIAERLCNPTELRRTDNGRKDPNSRERWPDTQARALYQAAQIVRENIAAALAEV